MKTLILAMALLVATDAFAVRQRAIRRFYAGNQTVPPASAAQTPAPAVAVTSSTITHTLADGTSTLLDVVVRGSRQACNDSGGVYLQEIQRQGSGYIQIVDSCHLPQDTNAFVGFEAVGNGYYRPFLDGGGVNTICAAERASIGSQSSYCAQPVQGYQQQSQSQFDAAIDAAGGEGCASSWRSMNGLAMGIGYNRHILYRDSRNISVLAVGDIIGTSECSLLRSVQGSTASYSMPAANGTAKQETGACPLAIVTEFRKFNPSWAQQCREGIVRPDTNVYVEVDVNY